MILKLALFCVPIHWRIYNCGFKEAYVQTHFTYEKHSYIEVMLLLPAIVQISSVLLTEEGGGNLAKLTNK